MNATWRERLAIWLSWRVPRLLARWVFVRVAVHGYNEYPADRTTGEALRAWDAQ
jgi:hypothetical protein